MTRPLSALVALVVLVLSAACLSACIVGTGPNALDCIVDAVVNTVPHITCVPASQVNPPR